MKHYSWLLLLGFSLMLFVPTRASAQSTSGDSLRFQALRWRNIGPFRGGRSVAACGVPGNDQLYYAGYTGGGLWRTTNTGQTWENISDGYFQTGSVGDVAVAPSDPNVIYAGMGEHAVRGVMTTYGDGVYRSTDAGHTWTHIGLEKTRHISDVIVHPADPNTVWVAAQGALHGPNPERGIFKTTNGGKTWRKVLYVDEQTGASSLSLDTRNPRILYAATWQHIRYPWKVKSGGQGSGLWKSIDGGETWKKINEGLPGTMGKIGVAVSPANNRRVFAIVEAEKDKAGLYRSDDAGATWQHLSSDQLLTARSWYYMEVFADHQDQDLVYVLNAPMMKSENGGQTFNRVSVGHGDTHDLWINPDNPTNLILADDGGAEITFNGGKNWSSLNNQPTAQFYRVNVDNRFPYHIYGGQQDNSSVVIASRTNGRGITANDWTFGPGCESAFIAFDPDNPELLYGGCYQGLIEQLNTRTQEGKDIMQYPSLNLATPPKDMKYRYNWNAPIIASPHDPTTIYHAGNVVFKTTDGGINWSVISPDLTRNDPSKQGPGGGPLTNEGAGGENYNTLAYLIESPLEEGVLYAGSDCGLVHLTRNGGESWTDITPGDLPESNVYSIEVSPHDPGTAYLCANRFKFNDLHSYTYKTTNYGKSWTPISTGIRDDDFLRVVREDPIVPGLLYGGAERGFYLSEDGGRQWRLLQLNLPVVPITDLIVQDNDLIAATQGRAFWILDDLGPIQQSATDHHPDKLTIYGPKPSVRYFGGSEWGAEKTTPGLGVNPPSGVLLYYQLPYGHDSTVVQLDILDSEGALLRTYSSEKNTEFKSYPGGPPKPEALPAEAGLNAFVWDMRTATLLDVPDAFVYGDYRGRRVGPGTYRARLLYGDQQTEAEIQILPDPRLEATAADFEAQQAVAQRIDLHIEDIHAAINDLDKVRRQIQGYNQLMAEMEGVDTLIGLGKDLLKKIDNWQARVIEKRQKSIQDVINWPGKLNAEFFALRVKVDSHDPRVPQGVYNRLNDLEAQWSTHQKEWMRIMEEEVANYNILFRERNIPALIVAGE